MVSNLLYYDHMTTTRLLLYVLEPLIAADVLMWALYAHSILVATMWALVGIGCIRWMPWRS